MTTYIGWNIDPPDYYTARPGDPGWDDAEERRIKIEQGAHDKPCPECGEWLCVARTRRGAL